MPDGPAMDAAHAALHLALSECGDNVRLLNAFVRTLVFVENWATRGKPGEITTAAQRRMHVLATSVGFDVGMSRDGQDIARKFGCTRAAVNLDAKELKDNFGIGWPASRGGNGAKHRQSGAREGYVSRGA